MVMIGSVLMGRGGVTMIDRKKVIKGLEFCCGAGMCFDGCPYHEVSQNIDECTTQLALEALELLKEQEGEYERGFNDAMVGKQDLMYEDVDGKWHKKDW